MNNPKELKYSKTHEWLKKDGDSVIIGLTDFAQSELGDLVYINVPFVDDPVTVGASFGDVESVKAVSEVISPVTGVVEAVNEELVDAPELINQKPYEAWIIRVKDVTEWDELLTAEEYEAFVKEG